VQNLLKQVIRWFRERLVLLNLLQVWVFLQ